jgi:hypothetical protein
MVKEEDAPALGYAHGWNPSSELSLDEFLQKASSRRCLFEQRNLTSHQTE